MSASTCGCKEIEGEMVVKSKDRVGSYVLDSEENDDDGGNVDTNNTYLQLATTEKHRKFCEQADKL